MKCCCSSDARDLIEARDMLQPFEHHIKLWRLVLQMSGECVCCKVFGNGYANSTGCDLSDSGQLQEAPAMSSLCRYNKVVNGAAAASEKFWYQFFIYACYLCARAMPNLLCTVLPILTDVAWNNLESLQGDQPTGG